MRKLLIISALTAAIAMPSAAQNSVETPIGNPYLPLWEHIPDGEPRVFEDPDKPGHLRIYIIGSHDVSTQQYCGPDIHAWSAPVEDLSQWRDDGSIFTFHNPISGKWDFMFAPDLVCMEKNGNKEYYLYPHARGWARLSLVAKSNRPDGPFTLINAERTPNNIQAKEGSVMGFDPSVFVDKITNPKDPDYSLGYKVYGYWGFQHSTAAQLDPATMCSLKLGTSIIDPFLPASKDNGELMEPNLKYPAIAKGQNLRTFNFFEASSIRKVGSKYVMVYSGYSGPEYGMWNSNSTLRYAYSDSPLGPWVGGGVLVDSRGIVLNEDGSDLEISYSSHNTHGSLQQINGQWYVFYHRPPRGNGWARQAMVAPVKIVDDNKAVSAGGKIKITGYDPYAPNNVWTAKASNGNHYEGAEVTSEGFYMFGLPPYRYYSAGYACYLSDQSTQNDTWDNWSNDMTINVKNGNIIGYKYFGFGGLEYDRNGIKAFEGTEPGNGTKLNLFLASKTDKAFKIKVMLDGPYTTDAWLGKQIATINVPAGAPKFVYKYTVDVASAVDKLDKKHAIFLVAESEAEGDLCELYGLGFSSKNTECIRPESPTVEILINGKKVDFPTTPEPASQINGYTSTNHYHYNLKPGNGMLPRVSAKCNNKEVHIRIHQAQNFHDQAIVTCEYKGQEKHYHVVLEGSEY